MERVILDDIELVKPEGVKVVGLQAGFLRGASRSSFGTFPPRGELLAEDVGPIPGFTIPPRTKRIALYIGIEATDPGQASFESLQVFYRVGSERYVEDVPASFEASTRVAPGDLRTLRR